ncbi:MULTISPECIES: hypothetical protein [Streptosporangium]|uniref:Disulfide bond formation protein DsbB n=1 Tax=Streptosporangium brasiliense TaxID=47480 RepID=A0ABT9R5C7_9ACTN|nr:hypothetical protein [Streptosporangium brasiliense]MDP9864082.1 disulfide bond formation protein DsbB [Streptosporangium brasiliense]
MPHVFRSTGGRPSRFRLNSDGRRHPVENVLSVVTLACGLIAFLSAFVPSAHAVGAWLGTVGFFGGLYSQYVSATTAERALNIVGIVASFVGVALGIYHGGFYP